MSDSPFVECAKAYVRNNSGFYTIVPGQYQALLYAWKGGQSFFHGTTVDGEEITIKLGEVESVLYCTPASQLAAVERQQREAKVSDRETFE